MDRPRDSEPSARAWTSLYILAAIAVLYLARPVLVPFALAILLTFVVAPVVARVERVVRGRAAAVGIVTVALIGLFAGGALVIGQKFVSFADDLPAYRDTIVRKVRAIQTGPGSLLGRTARVVRGIGEEIAKPPDAAQNKPEAPVPPADPVVPVEGARGKPPPAATADSPQLVWAMLRSLAQPLASGAIVILLLVIMLVSRESIRDRLIRLAGLRQIGLTTQMLEEAGRRVGSYLRAQVLLNTGYGTCVAIGLFAIGVPSAALFGLFAGVLRFIPIVGPWLGAGIPAAVSLAVFDGWHHLLMVAGLFAILEILCNMVMEPWLYGSRAGLSSFGVVVAIIFWTWVWGGVGLVLAVPMTACLIVFARQVPHWGALAILLGDEPVLADSMRFYQRLLCKDDNEATAILAAAPADTVPADTLDAVVIGGLAAARADRRRGLITGTQSAEVAASAGEIASEWLADLEAPNPPPTRPPPAPRAVCIPLGDEIDEAAARVLGQLLQRDGVDAEIASSSLLLSERIDAAAAPGVGVIVVCAVGEAIPIQEARIFRAIKRRIPQRPVLLVNWGRVSARAVQATGDSATPYAAVDSSSAAIRTVAALLGTTPSSAAQPVPREGLAPFGLGAPFPNASPRLEIR